MPWKILRVLTTNACNYRCLYCHNEGQPTAKEKKELTFEQFQCVMEKITGSGIREVRFSGGEPLLNKATLNMIEWVDRNTDYEVGLATNGSLVTESFAARLAKTRVMVTLHLPAVKSENYSAVTCADKRNFDKCVELFDNYGINYSFNSVLYPATIENLDAVINYSITRGKQLKLLPYLEHDFKNFSAVTINGMDERLKSFNGKKTRDEFNGITWWRFPNGAAIKLIDSPCYGKDISKCRAYAEIRLLPSLELQTCIFGQSVKLNGVDNIKEILDELWNKFQACPQRLRR